MIPGLVLGLVLQAGHAACDADYEALRFRDAAVSCLAAVSQTPQNELPPVYLQLGVSFAVLGDDARANTAFTSLLALEPRATLPGSLSPKFRQLLASARAHGATGPVTLTVTEGPTAASAASRWLHVWVSDGEAHPVTRLIARGAGLGSSALRADPASGETLLAPPGPNVRGVDVLALDRFGGQLGSQHFELSSTAHARSWLVSWPAWTGLAGAFAIAGGALGIAAQQTQLGAQGERPAVAARNEQAAAQREAVAANVGYGLAAGAAITALVFFFVARAEQ